MNKADWKTVKEFEDITYRNLVEWRELPSTDQKCVMRFAQKRWGNYTKPFWMLVKTLLLV